MHGHMNVKYCKMSTGKTLKEKGCAMNGVAG